VRGADAASAVAVLLYVPAVFRRLLIAPDETAPGTVWSLLPRMVACEMVASRGKTRPSLLQPRSVAGDCMERLVAPPEPNSASL